jgi:hypothetical protein
MRPLGVGLFSGKERNDGISLLAQIGMIGLFGFACQVVMLSAWRPGTKANWSKIGACAPLLITALFAQPIAGAPTIYVILLAYLPRLRHAPRLKPPEGASKSAESLASADQVPCLQAVARNA